MSGETEGKAGEAYRPLMVLMIGSSFNGRFECQPLTGSGLGSGFDI